MDCRLCFLDNMRRNTGIDAIGHNIADRCRRRNQNGVPRQHHVDAFWVYEIAMLDRVDAGRGRPLDSLRAMSMRVGNFSGSVGFLDRGLHLRHGELRTADVGAAGQDAPARNELDVIGPGLELLARGAPHLVGAINLSADQMPPVPTRHAQCATAQKEARRNAQPLLRGPAERKVDGMRCAAIPYGCHPAVQRVERVDGGVYERNHLIDR